jgi:hypothetical protein
VHVADSNLATASFETFSAGVSNGVVNMAGSGTAFSDEILWTRADFAATQLIPEPSTYALMLAGLGVVGLVAARRQRSASGLPHGRIERD